MNSISNRHPACPDPVSIPQELRELDRWLLWRFGAPRKNGKPSKPPHSAHTGRECDHTAPESWAPFPLAHERAAAEGWGLGIAMNGDGLVGIDLDDCRDPASGVLSPWAEEAVDSLTTYSEVSPSRSGLRIIATGSLPRAGGKRAAVELYADRRYVTITGRRLPTAPMTVESRPAELLDLWSRYIGRGAPADVRPATLSPSGLTDEEIIRRASAARNGANFARLWAGDTSGYPSHSEADLALCALLAYWVGPDRARIEALFAASGLARGKWTSRADYRARTIRMALGRVRSHYQPASLSGDGAPPCVLFQCAHYATKKVEKSPWNLRTEDVIAHLRRAVPLLSWRSRTELARARLAALVELLQQVGGGRPFALATRWTGAVLECSEATARALIRAAVQAGVLVRVTADEDRPERHRARLADEYRIGDGNRK